MQFALAELLVRNYAQRAWKLGNFLKNKHHRNCTIFSKPTIVHKNNGAYAS
jgi:hypothetical protein